MPAEPLQTLQRIRKRAVEEGRKALATSLDAAAAALAAVREAEQAILRETARATETAGGDDLVEAFAAWLPAARHRLSQALNMRDRAEAEVARRRADLSACRSSLAAIEELCTARLAERLDRAARSEARELEDWPGGTTTDGS